MSSIKTFAARLAAVAVAVAAALAVAAPVSAQAAGWSTDGKTYSVVGQEGYPTGTSSVTLTSGTTLDLSQADAVNNSWSGSWYDYGQFVIAGDVTIIGSPSTEFTGFVFSTTPDNAYRGANGQAHKIKLVDFKNRYRNSWGWPVLRGNAEITYDGDCLLPAIAVHSDGLSFRFKPVDESARLAITRICQQFNYPAELVAFEGGIVSITSGIEANAITIEDGCSVEAGLASVNHSDNVLEGVLSAPQVTISGSKVTATVSEESHAPSSVGSYNRYAVIGWTAGYYSDLVENSFVKIDNSTVIVDNTVGKYYTGIGCVEQICISDNSTVTVKAPIAVTKANDDNYIAGIGGVFESIAIKDSTVDAQGGWGAGIGWAEYFSSGNRYGKDETSSILIEDSKVTATSVDGAAIGSCPIDIPRASSGYEEAKEYVPAVNVTIKGSSDVKAYSINGAGIGGGADKPINNVPVGEPLEIAGAGIAGWGTDPTYGGDEDGEAQASLSLLAQPDDPPATIKDYVLFNEGTLTVEGTASVHAESGSYAIAMAGGVTADQTMVQVTLKEAADTSEGSVELMMGGADAAGTAQVKLGDVRENYRSLASTVDTAGGSVHFYWGSGEGAERMVNWNEEAGDLYTDTFTVSEKNFSSCYAMPPTELYGVLAVTGTHTVGSTLTASTSGLEPSGAASSCQVQWYRNGAPVDGANAWSFTPQSAGVYQAVATGTGSYSGRVESDPVTVSAAGTTAPAAPVLDAVTTNSITLKAPQDTGAVVYSINYGNSWQSGLTFDNLSAGTTYTIVCRAQGSVDEPWSEPVVATTLRGTIDSTHYTFDYQTEQIFYSLGIEVFEDATCQKRVLRGSTVTSYLDAAGGTTLYARYKGDASTDAKDLLAIPLERGEAPALTVVSRTDSSVTIGTTAGIAYNYAKTGESALDETAFVGTGNNVTIGGLDAATEYTFLTRRPATESSFHSKEGSVTVRTKQRGAAAPVVSGSYAVSTTDPEKFVYTVEATGLPEGSAVEYRMDNGAWQDNPVFDNIDPKSSHTFSARAKETEDAAEGAVGTGAQVTFDLLAGQGSVSVAGWTYGDAAQEPVATSVTNGAASVSLAYKPSDAADSAYVSDAPTAAGTYTVRATFAATAVYDQVVATAELTISPRPVKLTWSADSFVYNGKDQAPTATVANLVTGDTCTVTVTVAGDHAAAGSYTARATALDNANYTLTGGENVTHAYRIVHQGSGSGSTPSRPTYEPVVEEAEHGTVSVSPERPREGDVVTIAPTPDEGFEVRDVTVADKDGELVEVTPADDGTWTFKQPVGAVTISVTFGCDGGALCVSGAFPDVDQGAWYHDAVDWALVAGAMHGYGSGLFGPDDALVREQAAAVLFNLLGAGDDPTPAAPLSDVAPDQWYFEAVSWAVAEGVMSGYGGTDVFGVGDALTREQFAAALANACGADLSAADPSVFAGFSDADAVSDWAEGALAWAVESGVVHGADLSGGVRELQPGREISRAEMAAMMMNAVESGVLMPA